MFKKIYLVMIILITSLSCHADYSQLLYKDMKILIIGSGGREHALAWKVSQSPWVAKIYVAPGNAGTVAENKVENINIAATDIDALLAFAIKNNVDLTIVGPETPLARGIVDKFSEKKQPCFGPTQAAAQLESSKVFSKNFMKRHNIPTAKYATFTDYTAAKEYVIQNGAPIVIKADGLANGKGVVVAHNTADALAFLKELMIDGKLNSAGNTVVIEEFLQGEELSFMVVADGKNFIPLATSQDHKQLYDHDLGPNTGGMGAYSPVNIINYETNKIILRDIVSATIDGMAKENITYHGILYVGLIMTSTGPKVIEYNCRFGDPEAQVLLMRLNSDLIELSAATLEKRLDKIKLAWDKRSAITVVVASDTYPNSSDKKTILSLNTELPKDSKIFQANTSLNEGVLIAQSGRVLTVTTLADSLQDAHSATYKLINDANWQGIQYRKDIGHRELAREAEMSASN